MSRDYPRVEITSRRQWRDWLDRHHDSAAGVWLITYKRADPERHVPYPAVVEEALCFGWVDSLPRKLDDRRSQLLVTPRKPGSNWSKANKDRVARLEAAGLMHPTGVAVVQAARRDGSWSALDDVERLIEPPDLKEALDANADARRHFSAFPPSTRRGILEWILGAKRPETRASRIAKTVELASQNIRANQWRQPG